MKKIGFIGLGKLVVGSAEFSIEMPPPQAESNKLIRKLKVRARQNPNEGRLARRLKCRIK